MRCCFGPIVRLVLVGLVTTLVGCSQPPRNNGSFRVAKSNCALHQFGDRIALAVWADEAQPDSAAASEKGYVGTMRLSGNRQLFWNCVTADGKHGTVSFQVDGKYFPKDSVYQLAVGPLFLITTRGEGVTIRQMNPDLTGVSSDNRGLAEGEAKLKALGESDNVVKEFLAAVGKQ